MVNLCRESERHIHSFKSSRKNMNDGIYKCSVIVDPLFNSEKCNVLDSIRFRDLSHHKPTLYQLN